MSHPDYPTAAHVDGSAAPAALAYTPGVDFDPGDPDAVGAVLLATGRDRADRQAARLRWLTGRNAALHEALRRVAPEVAAEFDDDEDGYGG